MFVQRSFPANDNGISEITEFVSQSLEKSGADKKDRTKTVLTVEEAAGSLVKHAEDQSSINVSLRAFMGYIYVELTSKGMEYSLADNMASASISMDENVADNVQDAIRNILLGSLTDDLKYSYKRGTNRIRMTVVKSRHAFLFHTLGAMIAAVLVGILFSAFVPADINRALNTNLFVPIKTMYMNALKMVVAPVVFFSIISCIVQFSDLKSLGRIGGKIIGMYILTTVLAVAVGIGIFYLLKPGDPSLASGLTADASAITSQTLNLSIKDTIVDIVPSNFINPFLSANMLQLIFMAVIMGIATGMIGDYSEMLKGLFQACNDLFLKVTTMIINIMPVAVFCSIMSMMVTMGVNTLISVMGMFGTFILGLVGMMLIYCLLIVIFARINPIIFVRKYAPSMRQTFSLASSNASITVNMYACEKKIGINKRIFSLSIPLGATLNMDGTCVHLAIFALALARTYGVEITGGALISLIISIIVLSMGAPGIPGSGLICLAVLLTQIGVPVEAIGLVMGIDSFCGMFRAMSNSLGDVAVSTIVAKSEDALDMDIYRGIVTPRE